MNKKDIKRFKANIRDEADSAFLYHELSGIEKNQNLAQVYKKLAESEEKHLAFWIEKMKDAGAKIPGLNPSIRARFMARMARKYGPEMLAEQMISKEKDGAKGYLSQPEAEGTGMASEEQSHRRLLGAIVSEDNKSPGSIVKREKWHRSGGGNALRAAVMGSNDGLVSNLSLVMGVAGANLSSHSILITGLAGLLAGAASMALGEWLSVQSSRELFADQIRMEKEEIMNNPEEEKEELALIYQAKGLSPEAAVQLAEKIMSNPETSAETLAREELGIDPEELGGSAFTAAFTSFCLFALGAIFPVAPFFFLTGMSAVYLSLTLSAVALFVIGAAITLFTGKPVWFSGGRQILFGLLAAALTFGVGRIIGVSVGVN